MSSLRRCPACGRLLDGAGFCVPCDLSAATARTTPPPHGCSPSKPGSATFAESPGDRIGPYLLIGILGEGGMGRVWAAEQEEPVQRTVALKVLRAGLDSALVLARFDAERQALARMDHPNIAKVLDAGATAGGRPYFVMERIAGVPITQYCDDRRLTVRARLGLFADVCRAVQHAHQKGVIHRDLKPPNILVTEIDGKPVPKVIDFGVAKAIDQTLTERTLFTEFGAVVGTPEYMSPEQASFPAGDLDTRSDIYSLGIVLYELLVGSTPLASGRARAAALDEILRLIREEEATPPSLCVQQLGPDRDTVAARRRLAPRELNRVIHGDLDWVVLKALEKDRSRRYETAHGLLRDLERYLADEPVQARAPSVTYRLRKAARRHRVAFLTGSLVVFALAAGLVVSTWALMREREARRQGLASESDSREVAELLKEMLAGAGPSVARGRDAALLREILDGMTNRLTRTASLRPPVASHLAATLARVYADLGEAAAAKDMARRAVEWVQGMPDPSPERRAAAYDALARALVLAVEFPEAEAAAKVAHESTRERWGDSHVSVAEAKVLYADILLRRNRPLEAERELRSAAAIFDREGVPGDPRAAYASGRLAAAIEAQGEARYEEALSIRRRALETSRTAMETHPQVAEMAVEVATLLNAMGRLAEAESALKEGVDLHARIYGPHHPETGYTLYFLADTLLKLGRNGEAERVTDPWLTPGEPRNPREVHLLRTRARVAARLHRFDTAAADLSLVVGFEPGNHWHYLQLSPILAVLKRHEEAARLGDRMAAEFRNTGDPAVAERMAKAYLLSPRPDADWTTLDRWTAFAVDEHRRQDHMFLPDALLTRGFFELRRGRSGEAATLAEEALAHRGPSVAALRDLHALGVLALARHAQRRAPEAADALDRALALLGRVRPVPPSVDLLTSWHDFLFAHAVSMEAFRAIHPSTALPDVFALEGLRP